MTGANINVQDVLLLEWTRSAAPVRLTMINGTVLEGTIKKFDRFAVVLETDKREALVYKHAIASLETSGES
ncbi:MAG: RNA chaperone Hfq [Acidobacteriota bacterium]|nr:RNA chaperone Hfq [Acidobacteriota bacterium]